MKLIKLQLILIPIFLSACVTIRTGERVEDYQDNIMQLTDRLNKNPDDYNALRELSKILVRTNQNDQAQQFLAKAEMQNPNDPEILFYTGLNFEFLDNKKSALEYYKKFNEVPLLSNYKKLMEGRYLWLSREMVYQDIQIRLTQEKELESERISPNSIAVFPLNYQGDDDSFAPLSRGLSEMISIDLGKVKQLTILERIRIQALKDELALGQTPIIDPTSAPRMGKLLGASRILSGSFNVYDKERLFINLGSWDVQSSQTKEWINKDGNLDAFFQIEKELVINYLERIGIELTPEERADIQLIPTQNLEAFLSFCKGLEMEDAGHYDRASSFFKAAANIDPNFETARTKSESANSMSYGGGAKERITGVIPIDERIRPSERNLVNERLDALSKGVRLNFIPGLDNRKPAQEKDIATALPDPPLPPKRPN